jgi:hypothetical protein
MRESHIPSGPTTHLVWFALLALAFAAAITLGGCSGSSGSTTGLGSNAANSVTTINIGADSLVGDSLAIIPGDSAQLRASPVNAQGQAVPGVTVVWSSSDPNVATVSSSGLVRSVDIGEADITVSVAGASSTYSIAPGNQDGVTPRSDAVIVRGNGRWKVRAFSVPRVLITPKDPVINDGDLIKFSAIPVDATGHTPDRWGTKSRQWTSSDPSVASIDGTGVATGLQSGKTKITASIVVTGSHTIGAVSATTTLTVVGCAGVLGVPAWNVDQLVATYKPTITKAVSGGTVTAKINQGSSVTSGTLAKAFVTSDTTMWQGTVSGTYAVNNKVTATKAPRVTVTTEVGQGKLGAQSTVTLVVTHTSGPKCAFWVRYADEGTYIYTKADGTQTTYLTPLGAASITGSLSGSGPAPGQSFILDAGGSSIGATPVFPLVPMGNYYLPTTFLSDLTATLGTTTASIRVTLTANSK